MKTGQRYGILVSSLLMQLCLGATYAWSVFVAPLRVHTGLSQAAAQIPFTTFYFAFPLTMLFAGSLLRRFGARACAVIGGVMFGGGWLLASLGSEMFVFTVLGIGLLAGIGVGVAYVVPIAVLVQWFPRQKGLVTGLAVAGFGGGAALISQIAGRLITTDGFTPFQTFGILGIVFGVVVPLSGLMMQFPATDRTESQALLKIRDILLRKEFQVLYMSMTIALAGGFAINANLRELSLAKAAESGLIAVGIFALANAAGRLLWGFIFDRFASRPVITANLLAQAVLLLTAVFWLDSGPGFLLFSAVAGLNYGGVLVIYASTVVRLWGAERVGQVYGLLFSANVVAAPAAMLAGLWFDAKGDLVLPLMILAAGMILVAALLHRSAWAKG
jgi:OFA family oxalate/formate antiporter-like MFS transporter